MPGVSGVTVVTMLVCFFILHARLRVHRAPGIPCALSLWAKHSCTTRAHRAARMWRCVSFTREAHSAHGSSSLPRLRAVFVGRVAHRARSDTMCRGGGLSDRADPHSTPTPDLA